MNVAVVEGGENRLMVATLGGFVTKTGRLCTLKFTVKDTASTGDTAAIALPNVTTDDGDYPMVLDENMIPVGGMKYAALTVNILAAPQVTGIALDKTALRLEAGEEAVLNATVTAEDGANTEVIWNSENEEIATVADGRITAVAEGETTITAQAGDQTATCTVTVTPAVDYGYTVELLEDQTIDIQGEVTVSIVVGVGKKEERATYNAVDMELKYDSSKLKYAGEKTIGDVRISDDENGTLKLVRYGASLDVNTVLAALKFQPVAAGKAKVEFVSAKVDESDNASLQDAPDASWDKEFGFVTITIGGYTVTLPDEFEGDRATVPGQNYTFSAKETEHYDYSDVKATIDGNEVKVIDNGDGTYTIEADDITGDIVITGNRTGKIFTVTITGPDTTGAETAQYGVDYTFAIDKKSGYTYELKVNAPYTSNGDDTYTIAGTDITKNIAIEVTRTEEVNPPVGTTAITIVGVSDDEVEGSLNQTAANDRDFTLKLIKDAAYDYVVKVGDTVLEPNEDGSYTIPGSMINGTALTVTIEKSVAAPAVEVAEYLKLKEAEGETAGQSMWLVLVSGKPVDGNVYSFNGNAMFTSEKYDGAYCYLMISGKTIEEVRDAAAALVNQKPGTPEAIAYDGNVNNTKVVDINDAQLVYDMYKAKYDEFTETVAVENFLRADMDGSRSITVKDAAEIVALVHEEFPAE